MYVLYVGDGGTLSWLFLVWIKIWRKNWRRRRKNLISSQKMKKQKNKKTVMEPCWNHHLVIVAQQGDTFSSHFVVSVTHSSSCLCAGWGMWDRNVQSWWRKISEKIKFHDDDWFRKNGMCWKKRKCVHFFACFPLWESFTHSLALVLACTVSPTRHTQLAKSASEEEGNAGMHYRRQLLTSERKKPHQLGKLSPLKQKSLTAGLVK